MPSTAMSSSASSVALCSVSASDPVRQQREVQLVVGRGEVVDLEPVQVFFDRGARAQQHRHGDQRAQLCGHAVAQRETRQAAGAHAARHRAVDERHRDVDGRARRRAAPNNQSMPPWMPACCSSASGIDSTSAEVKAIAAT